MNQPNIRLIEQKDNAVVAALVRKVMAEFDCIGEGYSIQDPEMDDLYKAYQADNASFWVIEQNAQIKGAGGFAPLKGDETGVICELQKMYFLQELRGYGMGQKLLSLAIDTARQAGFKTMYLETVERMTAANGLYNKNGFKAASSQGCTGHNSCDTFYTLTL